MNAAETTEPNTANTNTDLPASLSRFKVMQVERQVQRKPIEAPIALISTNQPRASLPRIGPDKEISIQKISAFTGVPYFSSILPNVLGKHPSLLMEYINRDEAR